MNFAEKLEILLRKRGLKQVDVAEGLGIAQTSVSRWLDGATPRRRRLREISRLFEIPEEAFHDDAEPELIEQYFGGKMFSDPIPQQGPCEQSVARGPEVEFEVYGEGKDEELSNISIRMLRGLLNFNTETRILALLAAIGEFMADPEERFRAGDLAVRLLEHEFECRKGDFNSLRQFARVLRASDRFFLEKAEVNAILMESMVESPSVRGLLERLWPGFVDGLEHWRSEREKNELRAGDDPV